MATFAEEKDKQAKRQYAYQFYLKRGYRPIEAAAIVGNLDIESGGFSPDVISGQRTGDSGTAFGAAQWRLDRQEALRARYKNPHDLNNQLDFVDWELRNTHKNAFEKMKKAQSVEEATEVFMRDYEKPSYDPNVNHIKKRISSAAELVGVEVDPNFQEQQFNSGYTIDRSTYVNPTPIALETSTTKYEEPTEEEPEEVQQAKQEIAEKSFYEELKGILSKPQDQQQEQDQQQVFEDDFIPLDLPDPYNYITLGGENTEEFRLGGTKQIIEEDNIITDPRGQWAFPGEVTRIHSGDITMEGVDYPVLGVDNLGNKKMMFPNMNYKFEGSFVTEYPKIKRNRFI